MPQAKSRTQQLNGLPALAYVGVQPVAPINFFIKQRAPTVNDYRNCYVGDQWLDNASMYAVPSTQPTAANLWILVSVANKIATWINMGGLGTVLSVTGGNNITITGTPTINPVVNVSGTTNHSVLLGNVTGSINSLANGTLGQVLTAQGAGNDPIWAAAAGTVTTLHTQDGNNVTPTAGVINLSGAHGLNTTGTVGPNTATVAINNAITLGDLVALGAGVAAVIATTGDIRITAGNLVLPPTGTNASETQGCIVLNNQVFLNSLGGNVYLGYQSGNPGIGVLAVANIGIGNSCQTAVTSGSNNTGVGGASLQNLTTAGNTAALGFNSLNLVTTGGNNTACGAGSLASLLTGTGNVALGRASGSAFVAAETNNIIIGNSVSGTAGDSNKIRIGFGAGNASTMTKTFIDGIRGVSTDAADAIAVLISSTGQLGTTSSSVRYKENIVDMRSYSDSLRHLRPVVFNYKNHSPESKSVGLIAEEVAEVSAHLVVYKDGEPETVKYHDLVPMLLNEFQKHCYLIGELQAINTDLLNRIRLLEQENIIRS